MAHISALPGRAANKTSVDWVWFSPNSGHSEQSRELVVRARSSHRPKGPQLVESVGGPTVAAMAAPSRPELKVLRHASAIRVNACLDRYGLGLAARSGAFDLRIMCEVVSLHLIGHTVLAQEPSVQVGDYR